MAIKLTDGLVKFAGGADKLAAYEMFYDYWNHFRNDNGKKNDSFDATVSFSEKDSKMNAALRKEILRVANVGNFAEFAIEQWVSNPMISWATFAVVSAMIDMILPDSILDSIGLYSDVRNIAWGDSAAFEVKPRDIFVVSKAGRQQRTTEMRKQFTGLQTVLPELRMISVEVSMYRVLAGKESLADFVMKAVRSLEYQMTIDIYNTFNTAMTGLPTTPSGGELKVAGYTQADLIKICQRVTSWNGGNKAVIVGTQLALQNILPSNANYRYDLIDSTYTKIGYMPTAFGYDVMMLPQIADWTTTFKTVLDDTRLYIVSPSSQKLVKVVIEGSTMSNVTGPYQNADLTQSATLYKSYGQAVITNSVAGLITLA
jgi:hypothetical protein